MHAKIIAAHQKVFDDFKEAYGGSRILLKISS